MKTAYDWITVLFFSGLIVLFLHRSDQPARPGDALWQYLLAGCGCALTNWLGNEGMHDAAILAGGCVLLFVVRVIRPFSPPPPP